MSVYQMDSSAIAKRYVKELANQLPPLIFVSADNRLCAAATAEGLTSDNPNLH